MTLFRRSVNPGGLGSRPPRFRQRGRGDRRGGVVVDWSWNIIISCHVQDVCSMVVTF